MKKIVKNLPMIVLALAFLLNACSSDQDDSKLNEENTAKSKLPAIENNWKEIGYMKDGMPVFTINMKEALKTLSDNMKKFSGIDENYTDMYIVNDEKDYNLVFSGEKYRTSFYVKVEKTSKRLNSGASHKLILMAATNISCTTSDCSSEPRGCMVMYDNDDLGIPYCSPCSNGGKCTKTTSASDVF